MSRTEQLRQEWNELTALLEQIESAERAAHDARNALIVAMLDDGSTVREVSRFFDGAISYQRVGQILKAARLKDWGPVGLNNRTPAQNLALARESFYLAQQAQAQRADRASLGYATELRAFYGDESVSSAEHSEQRIRWQGFHVGLDRQREAV